MKIVAEIGASHGGSIDNALELIREVRADYVKFQTWTMGSMAVPDYQIKHGLWQDRDLQDLYREAYTPWEWLPDLFSAAADAGMIAFSTPFDRPSVDFLERLGCPLYKVASFELVDLRLISHIAQTGKPIILSCGQAQVHEIRAAVWAAKEYNDDITLLHCVSQYPAPFDQANLRTMEVLKEHFPFCKIGLSDHSKGTVVPIVAASMGIDMIEKHIGFPSIGLDSEFAMTPDQFNEMAVLCRQAEQVSGSVWFKDLRENKFELRRSLYFAHDYPVGTIIRSEHLITRRPNLGLNPVKIEKVIGKALKVDVKKMQPVKIDLVI